MKYPDVIMVRFLEEGNFDYNEVAYIPQEVFEAYREKHEEAIKRHVYNTFEEGEKEKLLAEINSLREAIESLTRAKVAAERNNKGV